MNYRVFSDESYITNSQHRAISALSLPAMHSEFMETSVRNILLQNKVTELKWKNLGKDNKYKDSAFQFIDFVIDNLEELEIRIDTIIWDTQDSRHRIRNRDDHANLGIMFYHLLKDLMLRRGEGHSWGIFPDETVVVDWELVHRCLHYTGKWTHVFDPTLFNGYKISDNFFDIQIFQQINSTTKPLCQIPDLFGGLAVYSIKNYDKYCYWQKRQQPQLFQTDHTINFSGSDEKRLPILAYLVNKCCANKLGVSIDSFKKLCTPDPNNPINFWHYTPQHPNDSAPVKIKEQ